MVAYNSGLNGILTKKWRGRVSLSGENKGVLGKINGSLRNRWEETGKGRGVCTLQSVMSQSWTPLSD